LEEAIHLIKKALSIEPENGYFIDSLGWALFKKGKVSEAKHLLQKAVGIVKDDPVILEHLGDVYYAESSKEEALYYWKEAMRFSSQKERLMRKIKSVEGR
jgi:Flp pilus assembly protein TadD